MSGFFGLFIAANYALTSIILVELISLERFTNAYGLLLLVQGIANLVGPPLAGWITDLTGNYELAFYLAGFFIAISGLLMMFLPARGKIRKYRAFRRRCQSSEDDEEDDDDDADEECNVGIEHCITKDALNKSHQTIEVRTTFLENVLIFQSLYGILKSNKFESLQAPKSSHNGNGILNKCSSNVNQV